MGLKTPLYEKHLQAGARMVDFGGWDMPVNYGSQKDEHHAVRESAGMFDVSHMTVVDLTGERCQEFLRYLLANDVAKLTEPGKALYSCMLNEAGGVIDDLIVYFFAPSNYRLVVNAATREKDLAWIRQHGADFDVRVNERTDLAMIAVQGPAARELAAPLVEELWRADALALKPFTAMYAGEMFIARTGYTGEDGWEVVLPAAAAPAVWDQLLAAGVTPCGLGARDTLRLEAAMNLYGNDMDESVSPLESGLGWTVARDPADRKFVGREALDAQIAGGELRRFTGLVLEGKGVLRGGQKIIVEGTGEGEITSGGYAPTLDRSIALARLPAGDFDRAEVEIRGKRHDVRVVPTPFVRNGKIRIEL